MVWKLLLKHPKTIGNNSLKKFFDFVINLNSLEKITDNIFVQISDNHAAIEAFAVIIIVSKTSVFNIHF